jgi:hypothetical protein
VGESIDTGQAMIDSIVALASGYRHCIQTLDLFLKSYKN